MKKKIIQFIILLLLALSIIVFASYRNYLNNKGEINEKSQDIIDDKIDNEFALERVEDDSSMEEEIIINDDHGNDVEVSSDVDIAGNLIDDDDLGVAE